MKDIMKIIKSPEGSGLFIIGVSETKMKQKKDFSECY